MSATGPRQVVVLDDYISLDDVEVVDINPTLGLYPKPGKEDAVYRALERAHPRLNVYRRGATPEGWHYRSHPRIPRIVGVVDDGWQVLRRATLRDIQVGRSRPAGGSHGYDPCSCRCAASSWRRVRHSSSTRRFAVRERAHLQRAGAGPRYSAGTQRRRSGGCTIAAAVMRRRRPARQRGSLPGARTPEPSHAIRRIRTLLLGTLAAGAIDTGAESAAAGTLRVCRAADSARPSRGGRGDAHLAYRSAEPAERSRHPGSDGSVPRERRNRSRTSTTTETWSSSWKRTRRWKASTWSGRR